MKKVIYFMLLVLSLNIKADDFKPKSGDLIFQESYSGDMGNAIKDVTTSIERYQFTHVGIVFIDQKDNVFVIEATHPKVVATALHEYLYPENGKGCYPVSVVGRLNDGYQQCIPKAIEEGLRLLGKEYDDGFVMGNEKYYCSEFIYEILLKANNNVPVFTLNVMTFKSPASDDITEGWKGYFNLLIIVLQQGRE